MSGNEEYRELAKYVALMILIVAGVFGGFQLLSVYLGTPAPFRVVSTMPSSMEPSLHYGDLVVIKKVPWYEIGVGDIIVFDAYSWYFEANETPPPMPVIHRVYNVSFENGQLYYYTWGDNRLTNQEPDPAPTPYWLVHGKVIFAVPMLGQLILFLQGGGYILLVILLVILVVAMAVKGIKELEKAPEDEEDA
ncbi:MAG: signal peptidase I [Candidatus Freyarchaeota archaeon]|nr:signal peptidase I [Candidatus Jordarchaeia archaeon]